MAANSVMRKAALCKLELEGDWPGRHGLHQPRASLYVISPVFIDIDNDNLPDNDYDNIWILMRSMILF